MAKKAVLTPAKKSTTQVTALALLLGVGIAMPASASEEGATADSIKVELRYRLEHVEQNNALQNALANTLRARVTAHKEVHPRFTVEVELDHVEAVAGDTYNSTVNGKTQYSVVADPRGTDVNQALLRYRNLSQGTDIAAGRMRINHLNQRFFGGVGWRQNEQTYDGIRLQQRIGEQLTLDVARVSNVNRIFGPKGPQANQRGDIYATNLHWQLQSNHRISAFHYDYDFRDWIVQSTQTFGVDYRGSLAVPDQAPIALHAVVARQTDAHNNPEDYAHHYHRFTAAWALHEINLEVGVERLAGNGVTALQTPLATLHAFQGFTDLFLVTPADGIREQFMKLGHRFGDLQVAIAYHRFEADVNRRDYGSEWNVVATKRFHNGVAAQFKYADYQAKNYAVDTRKAWLMLTYYL